MPKRQAGFAWHVYHDRLMEYCYDLEERRAYIRTWKPSAEVPIRLHRLRLVETRLGDVGLWTAYLQAADAYLQAADAFLQAEDDSNRVWKAARQAWAAPAQLWVAVDKAWVAVDQTRVTYNQVQAAFNQARAAYRASIDPAALDAAHAAECLDCPWDGTTLFPTVSAATE